VKLQCCMNEVPVGVWQFGQRTLDQFTYDEHWLQGRHHRPLSLSMPTRSRPYRGQVVSSFFDNLLPELPSLRNRLAARLNTGSSPGDILTELGRDCAGAVQLFPEGVQRSSEARVSGVPLKPSYLERFLKVVPRSPVLRCLRQHFRVALAGTNEKTALLYYQDQWRFPTHSTATTHIFKLGPSTENEWLCHLILRAYGVPTARCKLIPVGDMLALAVERFDRRWCAHGMRLLRVPVEDLCQALGIPGEQKYEVTIKQVLDLLLGSSLGQRDREEFLRRQILHWMLGACDGHAKNFSLFLEAHGRFHLAPSYDVVSSYPNPGRTAMAVGGEHEWERIERKHWLATARQCRLQNHLPAILQQLVEKTPEVIRSVRAQLPEGFPADLILTRLQEAANRLSH
jgi:serine/threonine-protein kinase HipA